MEGGIDADALLDYAILQIFPTQNRYEAYVRSDNNVENLAVGLLQQLLPHLPGVNDLYAKGSDASFKLQLHGNINDAAWFTKSTLSRFLHIVGSTDLINVTKAIEDEMSQLEEARAFHLSLYAQGHQHPSESRETGGCNSTRAAPTFKPDIQIASLDTSKNELLRAMDLRLTALRRELTKTFKQAAGDTCSYEEISDLAEFSQNFGATDLKNLLSKFLEVNQKGQNTDPLDDKSAFTSVARNGYVSEADGNTWTSKPVNSETAVKYGVSPAKVAQIERQSSTESESPESGEENQAPVERSRPLLRFASPKRSGSPMRRIQIGRSGSRRATAVTIKSLYPFPTRERTTSHQDASEDSGEEERSEQPRNKSENDLRRMSVQDAISLFESKQRDQTEDTKNRSSVTNIALGAKKSVLRRWSAGMGESSTQHKPQIVAENSLPVTRNDIVDTGISNGAAEVKLESDLKSGEQNLVETEVDVKLAESACDLPDIQANIGVGEGEEANEKLAVSVEWTQLKEVELDQMMMKVMENQPLRSRKPQATGRKNLLSEQRGGFYNHYKEKRDEKLRGQNAGKRAEKEEQFKAMQKILDERKAEMACTNVNGDSKKHPLRKPQKPLSPSHPANPNKDPPKNWVTKKVSSKTLPLPPTRKSWPSTPSPRTTGMSPAHTPGGVSSSGTTRTRRKSPSTQPLPRPTARAERSQPRQRDMKETDANNVGEVKGADGKEQQRERKSGKTTKTKAPTASGRSSGIASAKSGFYNKATKKSSVVPLESKSFLRKGSGICPGVGPASKTRNSPPLGETFRNCENLTESPENKVVVNDSALVSEHQEQDVVLPGHCDADAESETPFNSNQKCGETQNFNKLSADCADDLKNMVGSSLKIQTEEESIISPTAWVEIEEHQYMPNPCDSISELVSPVHIAPVESSSPRVRHSLSQMLLEENSEPDTNEWGNAENPPAMVYQKDVPKGLKRLLKFARKNKGDSNITGLSSPSVFSEGEDDADESKAFSKRNAESLLRKADVHANTRGQQKTSLREGLEKTMDVHELLAAQLNVSKFDAQSSHKMHKGHVKSTDSTTKATRSFFSLSAFRGSKPNETKLR